MLFPPLFVGLGDHAVVRLEQFRTPETMAKLSLLQVGEHLMCLTGNRFRETATARAKGGFDCAG
ncbi:MAG: hypothetical protein AB8B51_02500 [Sedimentitalea sp.]